MESQTSTQTTAENTANEQLTCGD